jgi:hypothetical protein
MEHGSVCFYRLVREIEFYEEGCAYLEPIVSAVEQGLLTARDEDTQEMSFDD